MHTHSQRHTSHYLHSACLLPLQAHTRTRPPPCPPPANANAPQLAGIVRVILSPIERELPFLSGVTLALVERPYMDFDIRVLGGDVLSLPALGRWLRSSVETAVNER